MVVDIVKFECGEEVTALYIDGKLYTYGDYYHNKIDTWIEAFLKGIEYAKQGTYSYSETKWRCTDEQMNEDICELADCPPNNVDLINKEPIKLP